MEEGFMLTHDIDWFAKYGSYYLHFASNGTIIPVDMEMDQLRLLLIDVSLIPTESEARENSSWLNGLRESGGFEGTTRERYLESFMIFASKGFYSFDYDIKEGRYMLVAGPGNNRTNGLRENLPLPNLGEELGKDIIEQINRFNG